MQGYWNQENFEGLEAISQQARTRAHLELFADYCQLKAKGLRKAAATKLAEFTGNATALAFPARQAIVDWLLNTQRCAPQVHQLIPHPLAKQLVEPTLAQWTRDFPEDAAGHRWSGYFLSDRDALRTAVRLDACDHFARTCLIQQLLKMVDHATHHLPEGELLYVDELVLACLAEAEIHLQHLVELPDHTELSAWHAQQHAMVSDYLQYRKDPQGSFADWCEQRQRRHPWVATYSYGGDD